MASKLEIVNLALAHAGEDPISALDEESPQADFIDRVYRSELDNALATYPWRFAKRLAELNRLADLSIRNDTPQYQLPADWCRIISLEINGTSVTDFDQIGDVLLVPWAGTDSTVVLEYVTKDVSEGKMPGHFVTVFSLLLGARCAQGLGRDLDQALSLRKEVESIQKPQARTTDAQQGKTRTLRRSRIHSVRRGAR